MPIYEVNGRRANVKAGMEGVFLKQHPDAKLVENLVNPTVEPDLSSGESNISEQASAPVGKNAPTQVYAPESGGVAAFRDGEQGYIPSIKMPQFNPESINTELSLGFRNKSFPEVVRENRPVDPDILFEGAIERYKNENDLLNSNALADEKSLPPIAREWLEKRKIPVEGEYIMGGGRRTSFKNTPEDIELVRRFIANSSEGRAYREDFEAQKNQVDEAIVALKEKIKESEQNAPRVNRTIYTPGSSTIGQGGQSISVEAPENYQDIEAARSRLLELERLQKAYEDRDINAIGQFFNELGRRSGEAIINAGTLGLSKLGMSYGLNKVLQNPDNELTKEANDLLSRYQYLHSGDRSIAQDIAKGATDNADFIAQFAATGGIASALTKGASTAIAKKLGGNIAAKAIGNMSEGLANAFVRTSLMPSTLATAYELNTQNPGSFLDNYAQAFGQNFIENFSEGLGAFMPTKFRFLGKENSLANRIGKYTGFQGLIPEFAEEQIATIFHSAAGSGQAQWSDLIDPRNQLVTLGTIGVMQLPYATINAGGYASGKFHNVQQKRSIRKGYQSNLRNLEYILNEESPFAWQMIDEINQMIDKNPEASIPTLVAIMSEESEMSDAAKNAFIKYGLSYLAYSGLNKAKTEEVETATQEVFTLIEENANPQMGAIVSAVIGGFDAPAQIVGGNVIQREDGSIDRENSDKQIFYLDADGNRQVTSIDFIESVSENIPVADAITQATEFTTAPIIARQENEEVRPYEIGEVIRTVDGVMGEISGIDEAGNYILSVETPQGVVQAPIEPRQIVNEDNLRGVENGSTVTYLNANDTTAEGVVDDMYSQRINGLIFIDGELVPTSNIIGLASEVKKAQEPTIQEPVEPAEQKSEWDELPEVPVDKDGNPDFNTMTPVMLGSQIEQLTGSRDTAYDMLSSMLEENQREQQKQMEKLPKKASELNKFASERKRLQNEGLRLERALSQYSDIAETRITQREIEAIRKEIAAPDMENLTNREFIRQAYPDGAPNVYMQVLFDIINGRRFVWNNQGNKRGIAEELGKTGENGHRQGYFGILASPENGGISFDDYVHTIYTDGGWGLDDAEIRNQVIEALNDAHSPGEAANRVREIYSKNVVDLNAVADYYEDRAAYMAENAEPASVESEIARAEAETDTNPTEAQKAAGNYKKGKVIIQGFEISVEQPKGSERSGVDENDNPWSVVMNNTYGYIRKTEGKDGEHIDVFLGDNPESSTIFVVDQVNPSTGQFDEHKVMLGFNSLDEARDAYLSNYEEGWQGLGGITEVDVEAFRNWVYFDTRRIKPFAEYKEIQEAHDDYVPFQIIPASNDGNTLVGAHNISARKLLFAMGMGGFANPSMAVIDSEKTSFDSFGDITLIASPALIEKSSGQNAGTFGADIYSPRYPHVEYEANEDKRDAFIEDLKQYMREKDFSKADWYNIGHYDSQRIEYNMQHKFDKDLFHDFIPIKAYYLEKVKGDVLSQNTSAGDIASKLDGDGEFGEWADVQFANMLKKERIFLGYTPAGNRRYAAHTLDNVSRIMKQAGRQGGEGVGYGLGSARAHLTPKFTTLKQIRKAKYRLQSKAEFEKIKAEFSKEYDSLYEEFTKSINTSSAYVSSELFDEYMIEGLPRDIEMSPEYRERFNTFRSSLREMPTEYFETKFERPVSLNEFSFAIVPNDAPQGVRDIFEKSYLTVIEYDPSIEGDRFEKIKALPQGVKFQKGGNVFKPIGKRKFKSLIDRLKKSGLAKEVVIDRARFDAKLREVLDSKGAVMRNKAGDVYGFVADGIVYLDSSRMNANTPIHEFGHLWNTFIKENNPELWMRGAELVKESEYWQRVNDNPAYSKLTEEQKVDEALAMAIGDKGEAIVSQSLRERFANWLKEVWDSIKDVLGMSADISIEDMTLGDFTDLAVGELLSGGDLQKSSENAIFVNENNPENESERAEARLDNRRAVGRNTLREALGNAAQDRRIAETAEAGYGRGGGGTTEEGLPERWDKNRFLGRLEVAARENGSWIDDIGSFADISKKFEGGYESEVYLSRDGENVIKLNNLNFLNDDDAQYERTRDFAYFAERIAAHNELFPKDKYEIIGFAENSLGEVSVVMSQPFVEDAELATNEQVDEYLQSIGFRKANLSGVEGQQGYTNGRYELSDIKPQNVLVDKEGNLRFIDLDITLAPANEQISKQEVSEMEQIKQRSIEDGTFMKAPNGDPTNLTERQWLQVRTSNFKAWFGDWQNDPVNASKVVDENGEPMVAYHGATVDFAKFDKDKTVRGFYFSASEKYAKRRANMHSSDKGVVIPVFLNISTPLYRENAITVTESERNSGADGIISERSGVYDIPMYIAFESNQIKSATANTGEFSKDSDDIRFQSVGDVAEATGSTMTEEMRKELDVKLKNFAFRLREAWEDKHLAVKNFLDVLRKEGITIAEHNDYYKQATHLNGKIDAQLERYNNQYQKPLNETIKKLEDAGLEYRDIENYVILKHGLERNKWMRQDAVDKYMESHPDATPEEIERFESRLPDDYSGITAILTEFLINKSKAENPEADIAKYQRSLPDKMEIEELELLLGKTVEDYISEFEQKAGGDLVDNLWKRTKDATSFALNKQLEGGLIDKKTLDDLTARYEYYIPLRGHDAETAEDRWDYSPNMGTYFVAPLAKAHGRRSRSESPFAYISSMAQSAINSANRNILNQTILRLARKDSTGLMSANKVWYVESGRDADGIPTYEAQSPAYSENPEQYRKNIEEFNERMKRLESEGMAYQGRKKLDIGGIFVKRSQADQHEVHVYQNGEEFVVYINANPAVARAINGSNAKDLHKDLRFIAKVSREMAANFTTRNPIFVASNFSRDYIFASSILGVKEDARYALQFQKNMPKSFDALQRYVRGKANLSNEHDRYLNEYILNGAKTGFSHIIELQRVQKQIERDIKRSGKRDTPIRVVLDALAAMNDVAENMSRLSVYITSREQGRSITQSVSDAKEVTVNFNRSGAGGMGSQWIRPLYLFVNAGIQALSNFAKVAVNNPKKATMLIAGYAISGFLMPFFASLLGGDEGEEEYWKLSDWERQNNLCIYTGNGFIKIPLPHELRVFHKMGNEIHQAIFGKKDVTQTVIDTALGFADLVPANPFGAVDGSWAEIMPDALKPIFQIAANTNFTGSRITNEWADPDKPGYLRIRTNKKGDPYAPAFLVKLAEGLDTLTGGDGVEKGIISLNPDIVNHLMRGYFGGLYSMAMQGLDAVPKTYEWAKTGELKLKVRDTPLRTFYASSDDLLATSSGLNSRYFKIADDVKEALRKEKGYKEQVKDGKLSVTDFAKKVQDLDISKANQLNAKIKQIKKYESSLKELEGEEQRELERIIANLKGEVVELNKK